MSDEEPTVFTKIINRELPADIVFENHNLIVIKTIQPHAPVHLLGIPKHPFKDLDELLQSEENKDILWELLATLSKLAHELGIASTGYKIVSNIGKDAGQSIPHLHIHMLGGEKLPEY